MVQLPEQGGREAGVLLLRVRGLLPGGDGDRGRRQHVGVTTIIFTLHYIFSLFYNIIYRLYFIACITHKSISLRGTLQNVDVSKCVPVRCMFKV